MLWATKNHSSLSYDQNCLLWLNVNITAKSSNFQSMDYEPPVDHKTTKVSLKTISLI